MTRTAISVRQVGSGVPGPPRYPSFFSPPSRRSAVEFRRVHAIRRVELSSSPTFERSDIDKHPEMRCHGNASCCRTRAARCQRRQFHSSRLASHVPHRVVGFPLWARGVEGGGRMCGGGDREWNKISNGLGEGVCIGPTGAERVT